MDEEFWAAYRRRLRERGARQFFLLWGPLAIITAVFVLTAPMDHPAGDWRDDPVVRIIGAGAFVAFGLIAIVTSARWLLADRRK